MKRRQHLIADVGRLCRSNAFWGGFAAGFTPHPMLASRIRCNATWSDFDSVDEAWQNVSELLNDSFLEVACLGVDSFVEEEQAQSAEDDQRAPSANRTEDGPYRVAS